MIEDTIHAISDAVFEEFARDESAGKTETKQGLDIVTAADYRIQHRIVEVIKNRHPDHGVFAEEGEGRGTGEHLWVIDPIDGTVNFAGGSPLYSVSIAYQHRGRTEHGLVLIPALKQCYRAAAGTGAWRGRARLATSTRSLEASVISVGLTSHYTSAETETTLSIIRSLSRCVRGVRIFVAEALELSWIAEGALDGHLTVKADPFSAAAGTLIVREAGGRVTDLEGADVTNESRSVVATNGRIHDDILAICRDERPRGG
jgi:myo-inositol-1(or 4)-monophosphatase